jgi:HEAT repeat protein
MPLPRVFRLALLLFLAVVPGLLCAEDRTRAFDEATCKAAGQATDGPALLEFFRQRTLSEADLARLSATVRRLGDPSYRLRAEATSILCAVGRAALPLLRQAVRDPDPEVMRRAEVCLRKIESKAELPVTLAAARLLSRLRPEGSTAVLLAYLPFADDEIIEEEIFAALGVVAFRDGKPDPLLVSAANDKAPVRRAAAALILARSADPAGRAISKAALADTNLHVRVRAAQGLVAAKDNQAVPALLSLLGASDPAVAGRAEELLCRIAGDQAPTVSPGSDEKERRRYREAWASWYNLRGRHVNLARLDLERRLLGMTLLVALDGFGGNGRVWEVGPDKQPRWDIRTAKGPIDAQILPGNRVLVAEYYGNVVTERDFRGNVLWQHSCRGGPVCCRRLPGGNTLIATNREVIEVNPAHKVVASFPSRHGQIFEAQRLRNGHLVYLTYEGTLAEFDAKGKEVRALHFSRPTDGKIAFEALPGGRFLVPMSASDKVVELDGAGQVVWQCNVPKPNSAQRLPNGNTLVCSRINRRAVEVDRAGRVVWEVSSEGHLFRAQRR